MRDAMLILGFVLHVLSVIAGLIFGWMVAGPLGGLVMAAVAWLAGFLATAILTTIGEEAAALNNNEKGRSELERKGRPLYRRLDLIRLMDTDWRSYIKQANQIARAYRDGRVL